MDLDALIAQQKSSQASLDDLITTLKAQQQPKPGFSGDKFASNMNASASGFLQGIPLVGPALDKGANYAEAGLRSMVGPESFDQELQGVEQREEADTEANPGTTLAGNIGGSITAMAPAAAAAPAAFGIGRAPLLLRALTGGATNAAIGGADSAIRSGGDLGEAAKGAGFGFVGGAVSPAITSGLGRVGEAILGGPKDALSDLPKAAQRFATREFGDPTKLADQSRLLKALGPEATPADVSPQWLGVARGAATRPDSREAVVSVLDARNAAKNARLGGDLDSAFGQRVVPSEVEEGLKASRKALGPEYETAFDGAKAVDTKSIADRLDQLAIDKRGPAQAAAKQIREMLNVSGEGVLDPNPRTLLSTRQAIDGMMKSELNGDIKSVLGETRKAIDTELAAKVPGVKAVDAKYAGLAKQSEALETGQNLFGNGKEALRPEEVNKIVAALAPEAQTTLKQGARGELDRIVGTKGNDPLAVKQMIQGEGDWNRDKLRTIFGRDNADRGMGAVDREMTFSDTHNRVTRGSDTAMGARFGDFLDETAKGKQVPTDATMFGAAARGGQKVLNSLLQRGADGKADRFAKELGRIAVAQGPQRDAIIQALMQRAQSPGGLDKGTQAVLAALIGSPTRQLTSSRP